MDPKRALVMLDFDGVIVDSLKLFSAAFILACQANSFYGVSTEEEFLKLTEGNFFDGIMKFGLDVNTVDSILNNFEMRQKEYLDNCELFLGMDEAIKKLSEKNKVFIISSNLSDAAFRILQKNSINCYEDIIGGEQERSKVNKIKNTMARYPNLTSYYVGDTMGDIIEGKQAGVKTIGVSWGWHGALKLSREKPDFIVNSPQELTELIDSYS